MLKFDVPDDDRIILNFAGEREKQVMSEVARPQIQSFATLRASRAPLLPAKEEKEAKEAKGC